MIDNDKRKKLMIDMDDVICEGGFLYLINEFLNTNYNKTDFKDFYMQSIIPENKRNEFFQFYLLKNRYQYDKLLPDAKEVIKELTKYYNVFIGTSYIYKEIINESGIFIPQKIEFLLRELPFISPMQYSFTNDKSIFSFDIAIDDKLENLKCAKQKILFLQYHNKNMDKIELKNNNVEVVNNWKEVKKLLIKKE